MSLIKKEDYIFYLDINKTIDYYKTNSICDCSYCRDFQNQALEKLPTTKRFLEEFGIDISRPDETSWFFDNGEAFYSFIAYTVVGQCIQLGKYEFDISEESLSINLVVNREPNFPNEQTEPCFAITIFGVHLPWILSKPPEDIIQKSSFWDRGKNIFIKH